MNFEEAEESHRQFVAERMRNRGRLFDIKTQEYEDENNN